MSEVRHHSRYGLGGPGVRTPLATADQRIGLLGGSFNPAHGGHLRISQIAHCQLGLDQVWWLVSPGNPLKSHDGLPDTTERIATARALGLPPWIKLTDFEATLGTGFTSATLRFLVLRYPNVRFVWIMGADNLATFHRWHDWRGIAETLPIAVVNRPGYYFAATAGRAGQSLARYRVAGTKIRGLAQRSAPALGLLQGPLSSASSTLLRQKPE